jgi:hypothetical protein
MRNYLKTFLPFLFGNKKGKPLDKPLPRPIPWTEISFEETLMFHTLQNTINQFCKDLNFSELNRKDMFHLFNFFHFFDSDLKKNIEDFFPAELAFYNQSINASALSAQELQELLDFKNNKLSMFAILKKDRTKPGVLLIRSEDGRFVKNNDDSIWSIPILGLSSRGLPFNHSNGCTPTGLFSIDSVMPMADKNIDFGMFRRLIVNFIKASTDEFEIKQLIPKKHHNLNWWKPSVVGRELGRSLLRIHGTGRRNYNPLAPYYPFIPTSGCLATNESRFFFKKVQDQRLLLDALMTAQGISASFENESKIHSLLYVVELDDNLAALHFFT